MYKNVRWETKEQKELRLKKFALLNEKNNSLSYQWCMDNRVKLSQLYDQFRVHYLKKIDEKNAIKYQQLKEKVNLILAKIPEIEEIKRKVDNGIKVQCQCKNGIIRHIVSDFYDFYGCSNYKDHTVEHTMLSHTYESANRMLESFIPNEHIGISHMTDFCKFAQVPEYVKQSQVYKTLKSQGVEFLCDINESNYNHGPNSSRDSKHEEGMIHEILKNKFGKKVFHQQGIIYENEIRNYNLAIPDYICKSDNAIYIFEAKKSISNINDQQLLKYTNLLKIMQDEKGINIPIHSFHIVFSETTYKQNNLLTIKTLSDYEFH